MKVVAIFAAFALAVVAGANAQTTPYEIPKISVLEGGTVYGSITTSIPKVPNSVVYKDPSGTIMTSSNTTINNAGSSNESLVSVNVSALNSFTLPTATAGVTPTAGDLVKTSTGALCMRINGVYNNLSSINVVVSGLLSPAIASPTNCVF